MKEEISESIERQEVEVCDLTLEEPLELDR